jgi:hypothetical protein
MFDLATRYLRQFEVFNTDRNMSIIQDIVEAMERENVSITFSIATRACTAVCILIACIDPNQDISFRVIEKNTGNKKNTLTRVFDGLLGDLRFLSFLEDKYELINYKNDLVEFRATTLHVKPKKKKM